MSQTVLVVDDSGLSRRTLRRILESEGLSVIDAPDGITAIEKYFLEKPSVVFLDLTMEGMGGLDVLSKLIQMDSEARVIIASADIQSATRQLVKESGAKAFINKPFANDNVVATVRAVLEGEQQCI
jgi:two-component system chemotaxis response regulator CheY